MNRTRCAAFGALLAIAPAACATPGGGSSATALTPASIRRETAGSPLPFAFSEFGGYKGQSFQRRSSGDKFEYSESPALVFTEPLNSQNFSYTITPSAPSSVYFGNKYVRAATITIQKVPGTTYTITVPATVTDQAGDQLGSPITLTFTTNAKPSIEKPRYSTLGQPYRYGVLEHPFSPSLAGSNASAQIQAIAAAGARFARIDYCGSQSEPSVEGTYDFTTEDSIMQQLAAAGMTELPIVEQYCAPSWANGGSTAVTPIWSTPAQYAEFAGAVAAHVAANWPQITRIELFNEPNLAYWWNAPSPYTDTTGTAAAAYMQAAYAAIKNAAPSITVVGPALSDGGGGVTDPRTFLQNMYAAGCGTGKCWDVLSIHNYAWMNPLYAKEPDLPKTYFNRFDVYKDLQAIAVASGETAKPHVMMTEWGISTDPSSPDGFDPRVQAEYLSIAFNEMNKDSTVDGLVYTNIYNTGTDFFSEMALTDASFDPLPGYSVYKSFASH